MRQPNYKNGFDLTLQPQMLKLPLRWRTPQTIFVSSMSDLFHDDVPLAYIQREVRKVVRYAYRASPNIVREATSTYLREKRRTERKPGEEGSTEDDALPTPSDDDTADGDE